MVQVAPIYAMGARERSVYFPKGASWVHYFTKKSYEGGTTAVITGPIDEFPIFKKTPAAGGSAAGGSAASSAASVVLVLEDAQKE